MNLFHYNELLIILEDLITLLEQTYDDVSHKYTAMTKLDYYYYYSSNKDASDSRLDIYSTKSEFN